jgi:hypothetical protein
MAARTLDCVQEKAVQLREKGKILYCLQLIADWNGDAYYWIVSHFEVLSLLKIFLFVEQYGNLSFSLD